MSKRAILFRFHKNADVCASRIKRLKQQNPNIPIHGIGENITGVQKLFKAGMESLYVITNQSPRWKWLNGDLAVKHWYENYGNTIDFDVLHIVEWDLVLTDSLTNLYPDADTETVYLTGVIPTTIAQERGWTAITGNRAVLVEMVEEYAQQVWGDVSESRTCLFPGTMLPRPFLEQYASADIPEIVNDELRTTIFADSMGFTIKDTGFYNGWETDTVISHFNCKNSPVSIDEFESNNMEDAYHPVRELHETTGETSISKPIDKMENV